ncbi:sensor histidine kinase [Rhizobium laguerreae]|uniref:sensor histidine kinase n=1 Tax=Rhizobium laguerreae TaxID=1076926 RepID=UPI001C8FDE03|nr:HAMP domain-containing sensor histidine kinase [Rhizobium laguerreae]MBY3345378.1 HAMP domain-containing histidine kinase [Rhizobium laguerreae]MBY3355160.1 HAMP domain-containing histidine kinase [Rhizobium laguerreae]MBY3372851.1 HAMP domain-containing histidine kinase [Rhizobium laguerreae]MBY3428018.1 HAMP domain-containing histidine kinase [Rhizobium laguerreae]MBY3437028.1 HAMP domain-containing histidine kinase [Rhizobium laguerreae]
MNGVAGTLDNLAEGVIDGEERRLQRLNAARAQLEQCITLIRNLAFLAQGRGGVADDDRRKIVLPQVIIESAMFFQEDGKSKGIEINLLDRWTQNIITGHPELVRQVLMNIFDNFIKYGKRGHPVEVNQRIQKATGMALIEIKGISAYPVDQEDLDKIGTLGFRGKNAKKVVASGSGLGMYICKRIIEDQGGSLHMEAGFQGKMLFLIKLPAAS